MDPEPERGTGLAELCEKITSTVILCHKLSEIPEFCNEPGGTVGLWDSWINQQATSGIVVWNKLYKKGNMVNLCFPEGHIYEDMWVVPIILERCKHILLIPDALVQHRIRKGSITRTYTIHNIHEYLTASRVLVKCIGETEYSFSQKDIQLFRDNTLRVLVLRYAEIAKEVCAEEKEMLRNEITEIVKDYEFIDLKSKAVWWMFQYSPMLLYHLHSTYKMINSYFST